MPKPSAPATPEVEAIGNGSLRISWRLPDADDADCEVKFSTVKLRIVGAQQSLSYDRHSNRLVRKGGSAIPVPSTEVTVSGLEDGLAYEAMVAVMNDDGWSTGSPYSVAAHNGDLRPRAPPPAPAPPKLTTVAPGKLRVTWTASEDACPPVEVVQVQLTEVSSGLTFLLDRTTSKLVPAGSVPVARTSFLPNRTESLVEGVSDGVEYSAEVACRNAEGFGRFSMASDSVANPIMDGSGMQLVVHSGPSAEVPAMEEIPDCKKMKVRWVLPGGAKKTMVKYRRVGEHIWHLCGGTAIDEPADELEAPGLEEGIEYEAMVAFFVNGRWGMESGISRPACIGKKKEPGIPEAPKEPLILADQAQSQIKVRWQLFTAVPALTGCMVKVRPVGDGTWRYVHPTTWQLVDRECEPIQLPHNVEVPVLGLTQGVMYEAAIAFRNKLGQGPFTVVSDPKCIGRPTPRYMRCANCSTDFDLKHAPLPSCEADFWCPYCRFRLLDPFNRVLDPHGLLICGIVDRRRNHFHMDFRDLKQWRKDDQDIWMRMIRMDNDNCVQAWPKRLTFTANGEEVFHIKEPEEGHLRRDLPMNLSAGLKPGVNRITVTVDDDQYANYAFALVRTQPMDSTLLAEQTPDVPEEEATSRVMSLLADTWATPVDEGCDAEEEITCVISNALKLRCPLSFERCEVPVRGLHCMHLQCFGLVAYLESNMKMRALNNRWTCPVCSSILRPQDLRVDRYVEKVLAETPVHIDEVLIMQDGSYRCVEEAPVDAAAAERAERAAAERAAAETAAAAAAAKARGTVADDGEVTEMYQTIGDDEAAARGAKRKANSHQTVQRTLTKRQRLRRERMMAVGENADSNDSG